MSFSDLDRPAVRGLSLWSWYQYIRSKKGCSLRNCTENRYCQNQQNH